MHQIQTTHTPYSISFITTILLLLLFTYHNTITNTTITLNTTQIIYPTNQKQILLPITNNNPTNIYLIQS